MVPAGFPLGRAGGQDFARRHVQLEMPDKAMETACRCIGKLDVCREEIVALGAGQEIERRDLSRADRRVMVSRDDVAARGGDLGLQHVGEIKAVNRSLPKPVAALPI